MSISLIGIIFVQSFFINNSIKNENKNFYLSTKRALSIVSRDIEKIEFRDYYERALPYLKQIKEADSIEIKQLIVSYEDDINDKTIIHRNEVLEEHFKIPSTFFEIDADSFNISKLTNKRVTEVFNNTAIDGKLNIKPENTIIEYSSLSDLKKQMFEDSFKTVLSEINVPIQNRVSIELVQTLLEKTLQSEGINLGFEFAIYDNDLATKVQSEDFNQDPKSTVGIPVFSSTNNKSNYILYVDFPDRKKYILSSIMWIIVLSIVFTGVIILAFSNAIYQLIKQRQISQIKTDFINNMTHEFKTPIATINLALDAIKNPQIINNKDKVTRYLGMIKDENKRMHAQVENVLRISKLEKNELNISKETIDIHDLIEDAITHIELIVEDKLGYINTDFKATNTSVLANQTHFTNVIVNILDNAVKYSNEAPKIDVLTENVGNHILINIKDQGNGMTKQVAKRVFEKFYREHTGNVHNVKGHGLGLAYVKRIVDDHQGHISVESEKGKGSTFSIRLPLIS